jgi:hypothetical protein
MDTLILAVIAVSIFLFIYEAEAANDTHPHNQGRL